MAQSSLARYRGPLADHSGTITIAGTAQTIMVANAERNYLLIQNQHATADLWVDFGKKAVQGQPSIRLPAGANIVFEDSFIPTNAVSVVGGTLSQPFTAKEG
jgi:hypothetical protein